MSAETPAATRVMPPPSATESLAVRCARLKVVRGPDKGKELTLGQQRRAILGTHPDADLQLNDDSVSRRHAELRADAVGYVLRDLGSTNGVRIGGVRISEAILDKKIPTISLGETDLQFTLLGDEVRHELSPNDHFGQLLGRSPLMRELFAVLDKAARTDSTVLIQGESGTGKDVVAESLHRASSRAKHPLVILDCSAVPVHLIESELFGHVKGAFTGADAARPGLFEQATSGTLFLDEIGELPLDLQPKLLRVLESRQLRRIGSDQTCDVDVRVIAATNQKLARLVAEQKFRADLYYRLLVIKVDVPPLRHRGDDVALLARQFVGDFRPGFDPDQLLTPAVLAALQGYPWPGNVRELKNTIERLLAVGQLATDVAQAAPRSLKAPPGDYAHARRAAIDRFEKEYCRALLGESGGSISRAAELAGITRQMFHHLTKKHDVDGK